MQSSNQIKTDDKANDKLFDKMEMLEQTLLELGGEVFALRSSWQKTKDSQHKLLEIINGLKQLLDDKGLITCEDFDSAVELGAVLETFRNTSEYQSYQELLDLKKIGH